VAEVAQARVRRGEHARQAEEVAHRHKSGSGQGPPVLGAGGRLRGDEGGGSGAPKAKEWGK
jgi:hypothetical protein